MRFQILQRAYIEVVRCCSDIKNSGVMAVAGGCEILRGKGNN